MIQIIRQAIRAWPQHDLATRKQIKALRKGYVRARLILGDRWLLARNMPKKTS